MIPFVMRRSAEPCPFLDMPIVADGLILTNGAAVLKWRGEPSVAFYACPDDMVAIHGHGQTIFTARGDTWEMIPDPWHAAAFIGTVDWVGNTTGVLGPVSDCTEQLLAIWKAADERATEEDA